MTNDIETRPEQRTRTRINWWIAAILLFVIIEIPSLGSFLGREIHPVPTDDASYHAYLSILDAIIAFHDAHPIYHILDFFVLPAIPLSLGASGFAWRLFEQVPTERSPQQQQ